MIENNDAIFKHYYHDQLTLALEEAKIYQLSSEFVEYLLTTNPTRSITNKLQHLLIDNEELFEVLRIFEIGMELIPEKELLDKFKQQTIRNDSIFQAEKGTSEFYTLVFTEKQQF